MVQFLLRVDTAGKLRFAPLQSKVGELLLSRMSEEVRNEVLLHSSSTTADDAQTNEGEDDTTTEERYKSIVYATATSTYIQSSAVLQILSSLSATQNTSKRLKALQYLGLAAYVVPTRVRDKLYRYVSKRRRRWFGSSSSAVEECWLYHDDGLEGRFVDDGVLTGVFRNDAALFGSNPQAGTSCSSNDDESVNNDGSSSSTPIVTNLFQGENPPKRGDRVKIIWPTHTQQDPSITYDDEFPNGLCLVGAIGTITTVDLPLRIVLRVDRSSLGLSLEKDNGLGSEETMIAWVKPEEIALLEEE